MCKETKSKDVNMMDEEDEEHKDGAMIYQIEAYPKKSVHWPIYWPRL